MTRKEHIQNMLKETPNDSFLHYALALECMAEEDFKTAAQQLEELVSKDPSYLAAYFQLGKCYEIQQQFDKAMSSYQKGIPVAQKQGNRKTLGELNEAILMLED